MAHCRHIRESPIWGKYNAKELHESVKKEIYMWNKEAISVHDKKQNKMHVKDYLSTSVFKTM